MTQLSTGAQIHRFHESVALHVEGPTATDTIYLSAVLAKRLGFELTRYAMDVECIEFSHSTLNTTDIGDPVPPVEQSLRVDLGILQAQNAAMLEALTCVALEDGIQTHVRTKIERAITRGSV